MKLNAQIVNETFIECLFQTGESTNDCVVGEGVKMIVGFHPKRLSEKEGLIKDMLEELPDDFKKHGGGGQSFLNMCNDKNENLWTGMHKTVDELVCLGTALGKLRFLGTKELWSILPGGMPYLVIE